MSKLNVEVLPSPEKSSGPVPVGPQQISMGVITLCTAAFILCILVSVTPLLRVAGETSLLSLPTKPLLSWWGAWLPADLHLTSTYLASAITTGTIEFLLLTALAFGIYALCAYCIQRQTEQSMQGKYKQILRLIWLGTIVSGLIFVFTPAMLSRDIFVYAGYGRTIVAHHANPYFVAQATFPQDPLTQYDDWKFATAAYGPAWLTICALWALVAGASPLSYILAFRLFAFAAHLLNAWLVADILRKMGRSKRTVAVGTLLYAWNPLVLQESCLGGHNDIFMIALILVGILFCLRAEQQNFVHPSRYLLPIIAFTLAALVKFPAFPLIALFLILLARNTIAQSTSKSSSPWRSMLRKLLLAVIISGCVALTLYGPFWANHSIHEIVHSFSSPPSAHYSENSLMRAIFQWIKLHGLPPHASWTYAPLYTLSKRSVWDKINYVTLCCTIIVGTIWIWRVPTTHTLVLAALLIFGVLLIVTPWFYSWYVTWLIGLAGVCLSTSRERIGRALIAFALTFSASAYLTYLFNSYPPLGSWSSLSWILMIGPPLLVFFLYIILHNKSGLRSLDKNTTIAA